MVWKITNLTLPCLLGLAYTFFSTLAHVYIATEHPSVTFINKAYIPYANLTSKRYGRENVFYYVRLEFHVLFNLDNNLTLDFYFYEYLSNEYRPSFVEMHFKWCDLLEKDQFFGRPMRQGPLAKPCPHPKGEYDLQNMSIPITSIPPGFPFRKGRIYCNLTLRKTLVAAGYINMEVREIRRKKKKAGFATLP